ncbi:hypothetical protein HK097_003311 [Rhizophlyctis rosea]|uniref:C2H2-type domain-containing protein n=1 Tax=Rhizophlyctis rosea TaxID=64517 RepID=A0AAD5S3I6_9FUNG|nr:hypothetical protein HK097_003311 [Rhizophlyctis rosea]
MPDQIPQILQIFADDPLFLDFPLYQEDKYNTPAQHLTFPTDTDYDTVSPLINSPASDLSSPPNPSYSHSDIEEGNRTCGDFDLFAELSELDDAVYSSPPLQSVAHPPSPASYIPPSPALTLVSSPGQCAVDLPSHFNLASISERARAAAESATVEISVADLNALIALATANHYNHTLPVVQKGEQTVRSTPNSPTPSIADSFAPAAESSSSLVIGAPVRRKAHQLHPCPFPGCDRTFTRKYNLTTHLGTHDPHRARPFECTICGKAFVRSPDLLRHHAVHKNERHGHKCGCGRTYARKDALCRHMMACDQAEGNL